MKKLLTAVLGLGRSGWYMHIPQIKENEKYELAAVVDPLQERLNEAEKEFDVKGYKECKSLFENEKLDLVVIVSPTHFHFGQIISAFENGVDVLCDKPITCSLEETDSVIEAMKKFNRKLMVYMPHRTYVDTVALQEILKKDLIGPVFMMKRGWTMYRIREDWQAYRKYGGGELSNSGAHFIDQLLYLSGSTLKSMHCIMRKIISLGDAEDVVKLIMETKNDMILDLDINFATAYKFVPIQVIGRRGSLILNEEEKAWYARYYKEDEFEGIKPQNSLAARDRSYNDDQNIPWHEEKFPLSDFQAIKYYDKCYEYFVLNEKPFVTIEETREIMRIIDECRKVGDFL